MCINHILNASQQRCINTQIIGIKLLENPKEPWEELQSGVSSLSPCAAASHRPQPWYSITTPHWRENCQSHFHFPTQFKANAPIPTSTFSLWSSNLPGWRHQHRKSEKEHPNLVKTCQVWLKRGKILVWRWCCTLLKLPPTLNFKGFSWARYFQILGRDIYRT